MAQNLHKEQVESSNTLISALNVEDKIVSREQVTEILDPLNEENQVTLLFDALLKSPNTQARNRIVEELTRIGNPKAVELLGSIMADDFEPQVQEAALQGLRTVGSEKAIDLLLSALRSDFYPNRSAAIALSDFSSDKVVDGLIEATRRPLFPIDAAIFSLAKTGSDRAIERLVEIMQDLGNDTGSLDAMQALVRVGTERAVNGIIEAWNNPVSIHGDRLYFHLSQFKPKNLIEPLRQRLQDRTQSLDTRKSAAQILGIIGTENEIPLLESIWQYWTEESDREVGGHALRAAEQISHRALKERIERERALEETRAFVAHEFRHVLTPLNAYVKMLNQSLASSEIDKEKLSSLTDRIRRQTDTAFDLVNQYLHYSRPLSPQFSEIHINELLERVLEECKPEIEVRNIRIKTKLTETDESEGEKDLLILVFRNVIDNALHAMESEKEGVLEITTKGGDEGLTIMIRDNGIGINPAQLPHIFNFGFTSKSRPHNVGFGLALSKRIVEAHNGSITIASSKRKGARVVITLPRNQTEIRNGRQHPTLADR